jgi:hypothetical protein
MHDSEDSNHAFGSNSDNPIRGRGRAVAVAGAAEAHNMDLIRDMVVPRDSVVAALTIALQGVEVNSALAKTDHPVGVVEILMMNNSYHVSYFNSFHPHSAQFS